MTEKDYMDSGKDIDYSKLVINFCQFNARDKHILDLRTTNQVFLVLVLGMDTGLADETLLGASASECLHLSTSSTLHPSSY